MACVLQQESKLYPMPGLAADGRDASAAVGPKNRIVQIMDFGGCIPACPRWLGAHWALI